MKRSIAKWLRLMADWLCPPLPYKPPLPLYQDRKVLRLYSTKMVALSDIVGSPAAAGCTPLQYAVDGAVTEVLDAAREQVVVEVGTSFDSHMRRVTVKLDVLEAVA